MALTAEQLSDMQADLAIGDDEAVFTDAALNRLYERTSENYNAAVYMAWIQIQAGAVNWVDYKVAQTAISRSQAFAHVKEMVALWAGMPGVAASQVRILGLAGIPPKHKDHPSDMPRDCR